MDWLESLQKLVPWISGLPVAPKLVISSIVVGITTLFLMLIWVSPKHEPEQSTSLKEAYSRMERVLVRVVQASDGRIVVDGAAVPRNLEVYYKPYLRLADHVRRHPADYRGAYEEIWNVGGASRVYINETQQFEAVVSAYFAEYQITTRAQRPSVP